jgi:hypothetical protein
VIIAELNLYDAILINREKGHHEKKITFVSGPHVIEETAFAIGRHTYGNGTEVVKITPTTEKAWVAVKDWTND